jgi:hypothetical protein
MELKNSLLEKLKKENNIHFATKNEFVEIIDLRGKLDSQNKYWQEIKKIEILIKKNDYSSLKDAQQLMSAKEYIFDNFFQTSSYYKLEPNQVNNWQVLSLKNYIKKQIFFNENIKLVNENFHLRNELKKLKYKIDEFKKYEKNDDTPTYKSLGQFSLFAGISFILFIANITFFAESGGIGFQLLNMLIVMSMLSGIGFTFWYISKLFMTKSGMNYISRYNQNKSNTKNMELTQNRLNMISSKINIVANNIHKK